MEKLAYIFPGMGYTAAKPVLYYPKRLAEQAGYTVTEIDYGTMPPNCGQTPEGRDAAFRLAMQAAQQQLSMQRIREAQDVLFIAKSMGTCVAGAWQKMNGITVRNLYFTPVRQTLELAGAGDTVIMGDCDPWADAEQAKQAAAEKGFALYVFPGCNHSLETGHCLTDLQTLQQVMAIAAESFTR